MNCIEREAAGGANRPDAAPDAARRRFLKAAPLGALGLVAGAGKAAEPAPVAGTPAEPVHKGYHETEHIRRYYRSAAYW